MRTAAALLGRDFYARDTAVVARALLGQYLVRQLNGHRLVCRIVETEAYFGTGDPASHAARGPTARSSVMFGPPGHAYVYLNYGVHHLLNFVTEPEGTAGAVLIRGVEPLQGIDVMSANRSVSTITELTNGPGKLTKALAIGIEHNDADLCAGPLTILEGDHVEVDKMVATPRIGITLGREYPYRFYIAGNRFVSRQNGGVDEAQRDL